MDEKIKIYESLLNELASINKECTYIYIDYIKEFGDEINDIFALKIDVITLKKKIAYCVKKQNNNEEIFLDDMEKEVARYIRKDKAELKKMLEDKKIIDQDKGKKISFDEKRNIKFIYYKIVHLIHPDLHPELAKNKKIKDLWNITIDAYQRNDIKSLKRTLDQILLITNQCDEIVLKDIDNKISFIKKEIDEIKQDVPYKFKFVLNDEDEIFEIHKRNKQQEEFYSNYIKELETKLSEFKVIKGKKTDA